MRSIWVAPLLFLLAACAGSSLPAPPAAAARDRILRIKLDAGNPYRAEFELALPPGTTPTSLIMARGGNAAAIDSPQCGGLPLSASADGGWSAPADCRLVTWTATLADLDAGMGASPVSAWSSRDAFWFLAERSGFLRPAGADPGGRVEIVATLPDRTVVQHSHRLPAYDQPPYYAAIGLSQKVRYTQAGAALAVYGSAPQRAWMPELYRSILTTWNGWRHDILPARLRPPAELALVWLDAPKGAEPGISASAGSDMIALQMVPREGDPEAEAKMRAALLLVGAHEGFHALIGAYGQTWPAWVNESLANHFAYRAARPDLDPSQRRFIDGQVMAPAAISITDAQTAYTAGDGGHGDVFYGKGARFWMAIEAVLTTPDGPSGRLGSLLKSSDNFAGVDWSDPAALTHWLDARSGGRAGPIVRCFIVETGCAAADRAPVDRAGA